jgi:hypothetical protein
MLRPNLLDGCVDEIEASKITAALYGIQTVTQDLPNKTHIKILRKAVNILEYNLGPR